MTIRRIELAGYWDDKGEVKIQLDTTGDYIIMTVPDAMRLATACRCPEALLTLRSVLRVCAPENEE